MCQILLVENHRHQRLLYEQEFTDEGYRGIVTASSGTEGLELYRLHRPELTILDILLPGMDGIALMSRILNLNPAAAIIVHSAYSSPRHDFVTWFARAYVVKSGDLETLKGHVKKAIGAGAAR